MAAEEDKHYQAVDEMVQEIVNSDVWFQGPCY